MLLKKNQPTISIIIPNYNHAKFLKQRIDSVLNQTYKNFELILLDDHSTDNSKDILLSYKDNPQVSHIILNEENSGSPFKQWHKGFSVATGDFIWIAESDDYCDNIFLEKVISLINKYDSVSIVYTSSHLVDATNHFIRKEKTHGTKIYSGKSFISGHLVFGNTIMNASSAVFSKKALQNIKNDYMSFKAVGDYLFWIYLAEQGNVVWIKDAYNYFRQHKNKVTPNAVKSGLTFIEDLKIFDYLVKRKYLHGIHLHLSHGYFIWLIFKTRHSMEKAVEKQIWSKWSKRSHFPICNMILFMAYNIVINYKRIFVHKFQW